MSLAQARFVAALLDPAQAVPEGVLDADGGAAGRRFDVYRNNVVASLSEALVSGFPVVTRLLGEENMRGLAGMYLRAHPPASPMMRLYGEAFPAFLEATEQLAHLGYLGDVARLELALRRAYHAADVPPMAPDRLAIAPEALLRARLRFAPAVALMQSDWPVHGIWRFNTEDGAPKPLPRAEDVLVLRPAFDPVPHLLPAGGAAWIGALMDGQSIGDALDLAEAEAPGFAPDACLTLLVQGGALTALELAP